MVSNYKRKTSKGSYSKEKLQEAAQAVRDGRLSGYKAAQIYNIPRMTIMDHAKNRRYKSNSLGRSTALSRDVESKLASLLHSMEKYGFGLTKKEVLEMVGQYVRRNDLSTPFKNGTPGSAWFTAFKERHNLSVKKPQAVEIARKKAIDPFIVYPYFELLYNTLVDLKLLDQPSAIWNVDETSFSNDPEKSKIVGAKGHPSTRVIASPGRENTTVLLGASAQGEKTPPLIIFKGKNVWDEWTSPDAYPGTSYAATKKGWMETDVFEKYFKKVFLPAVGDQRPILLIYDGHATHVGLNIIEEARKADITILKLPPHTSHILQPLDVAVMKSFKARWDPMLVKWQRSNVGVKLPKKEFAKLIGVVWAEIDSQVLRNGFRKAGIYPFNSEEIQESLFDPLKLSRWKEYQVLKSQERRDFDHNTPGRHENYLNISKELVSYNDESFLVATTNQPQSLF
ncbi:tigger transposable element-derived protein 2-like [Helicoverpa zea]|uniref:tigger transposable element-derived protein 2-like n=1 Tax=Helicoverpa zea TaxID=7113 RepID=UPI001F564168|nr:tigger transposable element-derived protein 2-like [Helicoverpa zea]